MIILPSTAKAFSKREAVRIQLGTTDFPVLKNIRKLILQNGGPNLRSVGRQKTYLESILSSTDAIWTLCCLMLPVSSGSEYERWPDAPFWTSKDLLLSIEARVIDVYFSHTESGRLESHVLFKLTESTIEELFDYYEKVYLVEVASKYGMTPSIKEEAKKEFRQSLARFNFGPPIEVLEGLESDGTGELLEEWSGIVKDSLLRLL
ncbi:hypothetical protein C7974DRAFT_345743, partial [Boeremia exigua]|uniref:uncharacterized protein n=1 Tax=Boeremia exigua TaxID=749465 RepID=UPI001E8CF731